MISGLMYAGIVDLIFDNELKAPTEEEQAGLFHL